MKKKILLLILNFSFLILNYSFSQPAIQWQKCFGGSAFDEPNFIRQTSDSGFIIVGITNSNDGDVSGYHGFNTGNTDCWVVKIDSVGTFEWQKCLGGLNSDGGSCIKQLNDGSYILLASTNSNNDDVSGNHGQNDFWLVKLSSTGAIQWQKCLGGSRTENPFTVQPTTDGGYILSGSTMSNDGDVSGNHNINCTTPDYWVVKVDSVGTIQWQKCLGGVSFDEAGMILEVSNGYIVTGGTMSNDGDVSGNHGSYDSWLVRLDVAGNIQWSKCFGGSNNDFSNLLYPTNDGGYVLANSTSSNDGDVSGNHDTSSAYSDVWIVKINNIGTIQWQKCLGGSVADVAKAIQQTTDGGYLIGAMSFSSDGNINGNHGSTDYWIVKLDSASNILWQKCLGGSGFDFFYSLQQTLDNRYILAGSTLSTDGDVTGNHGLYDYWVVKLAPDSITGISDLGLENLDISIFPNPFTTHATIKFSHQLNAATLRVYNMLGELVVEQRNISGSTLSITRGNLAGGVYVYEVWDTEYKVCAGKAVVY